MGSCTFDVDEVSADRDMVAVNFSNAFFEKNDMMKLMREHDDLYDVTLATEDDEVEAHKIVLGTVSPVLKRLVTKNQSQHPIIFLRGASRSDLTHLLDYIYNGEVMMEESELEPFISLASDLKIVGIDQQNMNMDIGNTDKASDNLEMKECRKTSKKVFNCLICNKEISSDHSEVWYHYTMCYYEEGALFPKFPPGPYNSDESGRPVDDMGIDVLYSCCEVHCCSTGKKWGYKEYLLHRVMCHRMLEEVIMEDKRKGVQEELNEILVTKNGHQYRAECFTPKIKALNLGKSRRKRRRR